MNRRNTMAKILLIEDEDNIRKIIAYDLNIAGHEITECQDGLQALKEARTKHFDVMIVDWMLPYHSGIDLVTIFRKEGMDSIIIMLTARDDESDVLHAFEQGVDDYMTKPFSPRELLARIHAHLKRQSKDFAYAFAFGDVHLDIKRREAFIEKERISLTKKEFDLLEYFIRNQNIVLSRDSILNDIWGFDYDGDTRIVDVHVFKLRNKLQPSNVKIGSTRGVGYLMELKHD